jgi:hypothetical protein
LPFALGGCTEHDAVKRIVGGRMCTSRKDDSKPYPESLVPATDAKTRCQVIDDRTWFEGVNEIEIRPLRKINFKRFNARFYAFWSKNFCFAIVSPKLKVVPGSIKRLYKLSMRDGAVSPQNKKPYQPRLFPKWNRRTDG